MAFGRGVVTDDITAHELTHGVTERTSGLQYLWQSGAINESMSDVFGEFTDLTNGSKDDTSANAWLIGEGSSLGVIRSLKRPADENQPGRMSSSLLGSPTRGSSTTAASTPTRAWATRPRI